MTIIAADTQSHVAELCDSSFAAFCEDMSSMFGMDFSWQQQQIRTGPAGDLWKPAKKLNITHQVEATGTVNGMFHLCFDQAGLFVLCGVIVMLPEARIVQQVKSGSAEDAKNLQDAAREVGNLLVGSWDRVFRADCSGHGHFVKKGTFLGKPWEDPDGAGLAVDEEVLIASYELTAGSYPSFSCAAIFPKSMGIGLEAASGDAENPKEVEKEQADQRDQAAQPAATAEPDTPAPAQRASSNEAKPQAASETKIQAPPAIVEKAETVAAASKATEPVMDATADADEARWQAVVQESLHGAVSLGGNPLGPDLTSTSNGPSILHLLRLSAGSVMTKDVAWADPDDTVQQCMAKMQQQDCRYVLVGRKGVLEGIISSSNIEAALSPYLRPMFAKWRRREDDATLSIKIKWIMSRPVRTVSSQTTLGGVIESMFHHGGRCLPVVNNEGVVQGIVTVFDILARFLEADPTASWKGKPRQAPPLLF
jgi:CBS domain-containing protein